MHTLRHRLQAAMLGLLLACCAALPAFAGGHGSWPGDNARKPRSGSVLPADAKVDGYSLQDMARATANFNTGNRQGKPPNTPFAILYTAENRSTTFRVGQGTVLYVPVAYNDNSMPVIGDFPASAEDRKALLRYWYSQTQFGVVTMQIVVDGVVYPIDGDYVQGIDTQQPLTDGATVYAVAAGFVSGLGWGRHTVEIRFRATGDALRSDLIFPYFPAGVFDFSTVYTVIVD